MKWLFFVAVGLVFIAYAAYVYFTEVKFKK